MRKGGPPQARPEEHVLDVVDRRFRYAFEMSPIGMVLADLEGRLLHVNQALCEMLGRSRDELLATTWQQITHPEDIAREESFALAALAEGKELLQQEKRFRRLDGTPVWALVNTSLVTYEDGVPACFFSQIVDID
jgi:PAS domain S-box-containing protein